MSACSAADWQDTSSKATQFAFQSAPPATSEAVSKVGPAIVIGVGDSARRTLILCADTLAVPHCALLAMKATLLLRSYCNV